MRTDIVARFHELPRRFLPRDSQYPRQRADSAVSHNVVCRIFVKGNERFMAFRRHFSLFCRSSGLSSWRYAVILTILPPYPDLIGIMPLIIDRILQFVVRNAVCPHRKDRHVSAVIRRTEQIDNDLFVVVKPFVALLYDLQNRTVGIGARL